MGLLDEIRQEPVRAVHVCSVAKILGDLEPAERKDLEQALADEGIPHSAIVRVLNRRGLNMHEKRLAAHRKGECGCAR